MNTNYEMEIEKLQLKIAKITNLLVDGCKDQVLRDDLTHYRNKLDELIQKVKNQTEKIDFY